MKTMLKREWMNKERGQSLVIIALAMVGLLAFLALVIDGGMALALFRRMQNASEAASLAGTKMLINDASEGAILIEIHAYAEENEVEDSNGIPFDGVNENVVAYFLDQSGNRIGNPIGTNGGVPGAARGVEVIAESSFHSFFAIFAGHETLGVSASAASIFRTGAIGNYVLWADSGDCDNTIDWSGSNNLAVGDAHTNNELKMSGSDNTISGAMEYVNSYQVGGSNNTYNPEQSDYENLAPWNIADYRPGGAAAQAAQAAGQYYLVNSDYEVSGSDVTLNGLIYVTGHAKLSGDNIHGIFTIVAEEWIDVSGSNHIYLPYSDGLLFFSNHQRGSHADQCNVAVIKIAGSNSTWNGNIYASRGQIEMSGSNNATLNGSLIGYTLKLNGSNINLIYDEEYAIGQEFLRLIR